MRYCSVAFRQRDSQGPMPGIVCLHALIVLCSYNTLEHRSRLIRIYHGLRMLGCPIAIYGHRDASLQNQENTCDCREPDTDRTQQHFHHHPSSLSHSACIVMVLWSTKPLFFQQWLIFDRPSPISISMFNQRYKLDSYSI